MLDCTYRIQIPHRAGQLARVVTAIAECEGVIGDVVTIKSDKLGALSNRMRHAHDCEPWTFGATQLMRNLAKRRLI